MKNEKQNHESQDLNQLVKEDKVIYGEMNFPMKNESYKIIGACMEVHNELGHGYHEIIYKDAIEIEFNTRGISFEREKEFKIFYKEHDLKRTYRVDFLVFDGIILEVKADQTEIASHSKQVLNYLASSGCKVALCVNFGSDRLKYKRMIL